MGFVDNAHTTSSDALEDPEPTNLVRYPHSPT